MRDTLNSVIIEGYIHSHTYDSGSKKYIIHIKSTHSNPIYNCEIQVVSNEKLLADYRENLKKYQKLRVVGRLHGTEKNRWLKANTVEFQPPGY
jgi:hypothetical protein